VENYKTMRETFCFKVAFVLLLTQALPIFADEENTTAQEANAVLTTTQKIYDVGTIEGTFQVSETGAATYQVDLDMPDGGRLMPKIGINYNSQVGNGLVGYGFNITGISCITRGSKDLYHDNVQQGPKYNTSDALFLDGKRLLLQSGTEGTDGAVYAPEGDPYTKVNLHGNSDQTSSWFEIVTADGVTSQYSYRLTFTNRKGISCVAAWYISNQEDAYTNYINYNYATSNFTVRPTKIIYGINKTKSRDIYNTVSFSYSTLTSTAKLFAIGDQQGKIDVKLSGVTTATNGKTYRTYSFFYNEYSDGCQDKFSRLTEIKVTNGNKKSLSPITVQWNYLPAVDLQSTESNVSTDLGYSTHTEESKTFNAVDINNDGISDIIRFAPVKNAVTAQINELYNALYIALSKKDKSGKVSYTYLPEIRLPSTLSLDDFEHSVENLQILDFDGDGYNDLLLEEKYSFLDIDYLEINILSGKSLSNQSSQTYRIRRLLENEEEVPLLLAFDTNGNGRDDVVFIKKIKNNGYYPGAVLKYKGEEIDTTEIKFTFDETPQKLFSGDYNSDGLTDILVLFGSGYKIYFNNGGAEDDVRFSEDNVYAGISLANYHRVEQGDFDGDGRIDFLYYVQDNDFNVAINNGDGSFTLKEKAFTLSDVSNHGTTKDDDRFTILVYDLDHDGLSDIFISKACYKHHGGISGKNVYVDTRVKWLCAEKDTFKVVKEVITYDEADAEPGHLFLGDFDGDGCYELANYGSDFLNVDSGNKEVVHIYKTIKQPSPSGNVYCIIDGLDRSTYVSYKYCTDPTVYTRGSESESYPVNTYTLPIPVVAMSSISGSGSSQVTDYTYGDLRIHLAGKGLLGFSSATSANKTLGLTTSRTITQWDDTRWLPSEIVTTSVMDSCTAVTTTTCTIKNTGENNYFAYPSSSVNTDYDGNETTTLTEYDIAKGVVTRQRINYDGDGMFRQTEYTDYMSKGNRWVPGSVIKSQKHADDAAEFSLTTSYTYDDKGNVLTTTERDGSTMPLTTTRTYDTYGNVVTSLTSGENVEANTQKYTYDNSGRFLVKKEETASSQVYTFTYDDWGNVLTENDETDASNILTKTHSYDGFGRVVQEVDVYGNETDYSIGWGDSADKKFYTLSTPENAPWVKTWYDNLGRERLTETVGPKGVSVKTETTYNAKGQITSKQNTIGNLTLTETFTYDGRGRVLTDVLSSGKNSSYSYANRSVTETIAGKNYTKTVDAWGHITSSTDPISSVMFKYASCGKPLTVLTDDSEVTIEYDDIGRKIGSTDPDAGRISFTYAADGKVLSQTDARGVQTKNSYDTKGRLVKCVKGGTTTTYTYGTSGTENGRMVQASSEGNSAAYTYDKYGNVITESRTVSGQGSYTFAMTYDAIGRLTKKTYPSGLAVDYTYDDYGNKIKTAADGVTVFSLEDYDGLVTKTSFDSNIYTVCTLDKKGFETSRTLLKGTSTMDNMSTTYDTSTGNLLGRQRQGLTEETFSYDDLDRLIVANSESEESMRMSYETNGNICFKTGVGNYAYQADDHPHAVTSVDNTENIVSTSTLNTIFNDLNRIKVVNDASTGSTTTFTYGPDLQRWYSKTMKNGQQAVSTVYAGDYEVITEGNVTRELHYLDGGAIVIRQDGTFTPYLAFTDSQGSILSIVNKNGDKVFNATYDAWGQQTVTTNTIGFRRGYCGHEMMPEYGIINMNGRLYDPVLGRFLSPDKYVQAPYNSQNYNRYTYCLNNPLKYTDPSGELFGIDDALIIGVLSNAFMGAVSSKMCGENALKGALVGAASSIATYGIGQVFGHTIGSFGNELLRAGAHGLTNGVVSSLQGDKFFQGMITGSVASIAGSAVGMLDLRNNPFQRFASFSATSLAGGLTNWALGGEFSEGLSMGMRIGAFNHGWITNANGELVYELDEVEVIGHQYNCYSLMHSGLSVLKEINDEVGKCRVGTNGKIYTPKNRKGDRVFYGNQYVKTRAIKTIPGLDKYIKIYAAAEYTNEFTLAWENDGNRFGENCQRLTARIIGRECFSKIGAEIGFYCGVKSGLGVLSIPLAVLGGIIGDCIGGNVGDAMGDYMFDVIYYYK